MVGGIKIAIEPFVFMGCILSFLLPIFLRSYLEIIQVFAGFLLVLSIMIFHTELQTKLIYLLAFIWVFGSLSGLSIRIKAGK